MKKNVKKQKLKRKQIQNITSNVAIFALFIVLILVSLFTLLDKEKILESNEQSPKVIINYVEEGFFLDFDNGDTANIFNYSNDTSNGGVFNCLWSKDNAIVENGFLNLYITPSSKGKTEWQCPELYSNQYVHYGLYEASIKTSGEIGTVVNFGVYSNAGNEIDIEFNGREKNQVELNYWVDGINSKGKIINLDFKTNEDFHTYAFLWTSDYIVWSVDGKEVWKTTYKETGKPLIEAAPILINFWAGTEKLSGWIGYLSSKKYDSKKPVSAQFDWIKYTPLELLDI